MAQCKESACWCRRCRYDPWVRKISWSRKWQPTPVFLSGKFHGQRSLAGYSPRGCKEHTTEHAHREKVSTLNSLRVGDMRREKQGKELSWGWLFSCLTESLFSRSVVSDSCDPTDCSLTGSFVYGISKATILEWVDISIPRGFSWPRERTWVSCVAGRSFMAEPPGKPEELSYCPLNKSQPLSR